MLILPLHRPLTRATFPLITAVIVIINVLVFALLQSGDGAAEQRAEAWYDSSGLAAIEAPLFARYVERSADPELREQLAGMPEPMRPLIARHLQQREPRFRAELASGSAFDDADAFARWQPMAAQFDALRQKIFTERFAFDAGDPQPLQLFSSMFLHGSIDHLLGNMLFLVALGLLVEGPLGAALYSALYLLAGAGAGLAWLTIDGAGSVIGASGAIAGLMGAFCVLWGLRRVRFFYWVFVFFDYVRAPALWLLPLWLGWEVLQMWMADGSRVAYSAHAGGIVAGAGLALLVRQLGWHDQAWLAANDGDAPPDIDSRFRHALQLLGQMQLAEAGHALEELHAEAPQRVDVQLARLRCARYARDGARTIAILQALLAAPPMPRTTDTREFATLLMESSAEVWPQLPAAALADAALRFAAIGEDEAALALFAQLQRHPDEAFAATLPMRWLQLAFRLRDAGNAAAMRRALQQLAALHPQSAEAGKARFLLDAGQAAPAG